MTILRRRDDVGETVSQVFADFVESFTHADHAAAVGLGSTIDSDYGPTSHSVSGTPSSAPYLTQLRELRATERTTLHVDFVDLQAYNARVAQLILDQFYRLEPFLRRAVQVLVRKHIPSYLYKGTPGTFHHVADGNTNTNPTVVNGPLRDFWVALYNLPVVSRLRELRGEHVGKLESICGTVTRTSEVRPELLLGAFECGECGTSVADVEQQFVYTEPIMCQAPTCQNRVNWVPVLPQSKFCDWQKVRVQENPSEIPSGAMPRSMDVILRHEMVEKAKAGDKIRFTGTVIVIPDVSQLAMPGHKVEATRAGGSRGQPGFAGSGDGAGVTGLKALGARDMGYRLAFLASHVAAESATGPNGAGPGAVVDLDNASAEDVVRTFTPEEVQQLREMVSNTNIYNALVRSIAPQVFGHDEIKRGILLQLMGGVHKITREGIHLRGDINVCVVGDPSTAKSQFLKYVANLSPRSVFTSGKSSSAAGLTAAVIKDEETGEFTIEAGALMLADNGICCIDEFDKMDVRDQVAIHEAMEQQTISIAKAGVQATLNARTSILAAANPIHGRYDKRLTLRQNIAMSAPIMSRFDLFFVVLDECDPATDVHLAQHLVHVHRHREPALAPEYPVELVQKYIRFARTFQPKMTHDAAVLLKEQYRELRQENDLKSHRVTVRQLESMVRLAEALARVHCDEEVSVRYVREAYRLLKKSILHIESTAADIDLDAGEADMGAGALVGDEVDEGTVQAGTPAAASATTMADITQQDILLRARQITQDELRAMTQLFVTHLQSLAEDEEVRRSELVQWYLEQVEESLHSQEDLELHQLRAQRVIRHLVKKVGILMEVRPTPTVMKQAEEAAGEGEDDGEQAQAQRQQQGEDEEEDPFVVLNPAHMRDFD